MTFRCSGVDLLRRQYSACATQIDDARIQHSARRWRVAQRRGLSRVTDAPLDRPLDAVAALGLGPIGPDTVPRPPEQRHARSLICAEGLACPLGQRLARGEMEGAARVATADRVLTCRARPLQMRLVRRAGIFDRVLVVGSD